jgi:hypothetical protein
MLSLACGARNSRLDSFWLSPRTLLGASGLAKATVFQVWSGACIGLPNPDMLLSTSMQAIFLYRRCSITHHLDSSMRPLFNMAHSTCNQQASQSDIQATRFSAAPMDHDPLPLFSRKITMKQH